jgi:hypothetical protein
MSYEEARKTYKNKSYAELRELFWQSEPTLELAMLFRLMELRVEELRLPMGPL